MDRGAWWATFHRVTKARHNLGTKPPPPRLKLKLGWKAGIWDSLQDEYEDEGRGYTMQNLKLVNICFECFV